MSNVKPAGLSSVLLLLALSTACNGDGTNDAPAALMTEFHQRLADFDTAGMTELVCSDLKGSFESDIGLLQALTAFGGVGDLSLEDFHAETQSIDGGQASVLVTGRLLAGAPFGSTTLDDTYVLRNENDGWCLADSESHPFPTQTPVFPDEVMVSLDETAPATGTAPRVAIQPSSFHMFTDAEGELVVAVQDVQGLASFEFSLSYDASAIEVLSVEEGTFLQEGMREPTCQDPSIEAGLVRYNCSTLGPPTCLGGPQGPSGSGSLAIIRFQPIALGTTMMRFHDVTLIADDVDPCNADDLELIIIPSEQGESRLSIRDEG